MSNKEDELIVKETIILNRPSDWSKWIFLRKRTAEAYKIWDYCNPDLTVDTVKTIHNEEPKERLLRSFKKGDNMPSGSLSTVQGDDDIEPDELTKSEREDYTFWHGFHATKLAAWQRKENALNNLTREIARTIASRHIPVIEDANTPYEQLTQLKKIFCMSVAERKYELLEQYDKIKKVPQRQKMDAWYESYITILRDMMKLKLPEVQDYRAQQDFLRAIRGIDESFVTHEIQEITRAEINGTPYMDPVALVENYRRFRRTMNPVASALGTYAVLGRPIPNTNTHKRPITCICEEQHLFKQCPYPSLTE
ncbi:hypothetical protein DPSP01_014490 [Paraphaeosphaeria sporulosa]